MATQETDFSGHPAETLSVDRSIHLLHYLILLGLAGTILGGALGGTYRSEQILISDAASFKKGQFTGTFPVGPVEKVAQRATVRLSGVTFSPGFSKYFDNHRLKVWNFPGTKTPGGFFSTSVLGTLADGDYIDDGIFTPGIPGDPNWWLVFPCGPNGIQADPSAVCAIPDIGLTDK